jgi:hypothetical protein
MWWFRGKGVFVIETKNMTGWIFGGAEQNEWTQKIFKVSHRFQNPLRQNYKHVKTIETLLGLPSEALFFAVVFVGGVPGPWIPARLSQYVACRFKSRKRPHGR